MALSVDDLIVKFTRHTETHSPGMTIWEVPGAGLYRVQERGKTFEIETLSPSGWMHLLTVTSADEIHTRAEAMQLWLQIQTPTPASPGEQEAGS